MSMAYSYKYTPKGHSAEVLVNWLKAQKNKAESLNLLILRANQEYGNQDIVDLTTQAFLNNQIKANNNVNVNNQDLEQQPLPKQPTTEKSQTNDLNETKPNPSNDSATDNDSKNPNFGFLSR